MTIRRRTIVAVAGSMVLIATATISGVASSARVGPGGASSRGGIESPRSQTHNLITIAESTTPSTLDPQASSLLANGNELDLSYQCLMQTSSSGAIEPELATSYTVSRNGLMYTFTLRPNVHFQNGQLLTSTDVVYSYHRLFKSGFPTLQGFYTNFKGNVSAKGPNKVVFKLTARNAGFPLTVANPNVESCAILSHTANTSGLATKMVGTGPWEQTAYLPDVSLKLKRFAHYWGTKTAELNLEVLFIPESSTQVADLQSGSVNIIFPPQSAVSGLKADSNLTVKATPSGNITVLDFNTAVAPFNNVNVRRAAALAINRAVLSNLAYGGAATPTSDIPPTSSWATRLANLPYMKYNPTEAKQLLAQAGYANGVPTPVTMQYITSYDYGTNALVAAEQSQLNAVGFNVTLVPETTAAWIANSINSYTNMILNWNETPYYANPAGYAQVYAFETAGEGAIPAGLARLTTRALAAPSSAAFETSINAVEKWERANVYPRLPILTVNNFVAFQHGLTGVNVSVSQSTAFLASVKGA
jgi:ABC-type transport system substrate-binding protein